MSSFVIVCPETSYSNHVERILGNLGIDCIPSDQADRQAVLPSGQKLFMFYRCLPRHFNDVKNAKVFMSAVATSDTADTGTVVIPTSVYNHRSFGSSWCLCLNDGTNNPYAMECVTKLQASPEWHPRDQWPKPSPYDFFLRYVLVRAVDLGLDTRPEAMETAGANTAWRREHSNIEINEVSLLNRTTMNLVYYIADGCNKGDYDNNTQKLTKQGLARMVNAIRHDPLFPSVQSYCPPAVVAGPVTAVECDPIPSPAPIAEHDMAHIANTMGVTSVLSILNQRQLQLYGWDKKNIVNYLEALAVHAAMHLILLEDGQQ